MTTERIWQAYRQLDRSRVRGSAQRKLADIVSLARYAIGVEEELIPFGELVEECFERWLATQEAGGRSFSAEQRRWLEDIRDYIAGGVSISLEAFQLPPFSQEGGWAKAYSLFGEELGQIMEELNLALAA